MVVAAAAPLPEGRAARVGNLHGPASAGCDGLAQQPLEFAGIISGCRSQHGLVIRGHEVDALVKDRQFGQFAVGDGRSRWGDRCIKYGRVAKRGVEHPGGMDRGHGCRRAPPSARGQLGSDQAAGVDLGACHMAVDVDAPGHDHPPPGIDSPESGGIIGP